MRKLFFFLFLLLSANAFSQAVEKKLAQSLDSLSEFYPIEKIYLHTDKTSYTAGETILFKAYLSLDNKPGFLSKVCYVELVDQHNILIEKRMYKLENGAAAGDIKLKDKLPAGTYALNAYTLWMLNFRNHIYSKHLFIYNTDIKKRKADAAKLELSFSPEGGKLLADIETNLGLKATGENGLPVNISGEILDGKNNVITKFQCLHNGMGSVNIKPVAGEKYTAVVLLQNGNRKSFALPSTVLEGINMKVDNNNPGKLFMRVDRAEPNKQLYNNLFIAALLDNQLVYLNKLDIDEGLDAVSIPKKNLPPGIIKIFVLDSKAKVLAERHAFIHNLPAPKNIIEATAGNTAKRKRKDFTIDLREYAKPEVSIAVTNSEITEKPGDNILSALLVSSELDGYIHEPAFYFRDTAANGRIAMELLMLNSILKFNYEPVFQDQFPKLSYIVESGIAITGKAVKAGTNAEIRSGKINLWIKGEDSTTILADAQLNDKGFFSVPDVHFKKSALVYYQATDNKKENSLVDVKILPSFFDTLKYGHAKPLVDLNPYLNEVVAASSDKILKQLESTREANTKVLAEVKISGKKRSALDSLNLEYASDIFINSDHSFAPDSNVVYADMWQLLRTRIPGLNIRKTDTATVVTFNRYEGLDLFSDDGPASVQFFLNEVAVPVDVIEYLNPDDVALIKSYAGVSGMILGATRGAIAVYTKKGTGLRDWRQKGFEVIKLTGYSVTNQFSSPNYALLKADEILKDYRPTLLWLENLPNSDKAKLPIQFYNDDSEGTVRVNVEGFDKDGKLISFEKLLTE